MVPFYAIVPASGWVPFTLAITNAVWLLCGQLAHDILAGTQACCLEGALTRAEPKRLRYTLWHGPGRLGHTGRRWLLRLDRRWMGARLLAAACHRLPALPRAA